MGRRENDAVDLCRVEFLLSTGLSICLSLSLVPLLGALAGWVDGVTASMLCLKANFQIFTSTSTY